MPDLSPGIVGIPWYRLDRYDDVVRLMADGASFPKTRASWRLKAGRMERELTRQGRHAVRIELDPDVFARWCEDRGLRPDSVARARYVEEAVSRMHTAPD